MEDLERNSVRQFNSWAQWYDWPISYWPFYFSNKKVVSLLDPKPKSSFLDVGCGTGILLHQLSALHRNIKLSGVDISPTMVTKATKKLHGIPNVEIRVGSASKLPYASNTFDFVTCCTSLHHHPDTKRSISEMSRVTKPGGTVLILDIFTTGILRQANYWFDNIMLQEGKTFVYSPQQMDNLFASAGLHQIHQETFAYFKLITIGKK